MVASKDTTNLVVSVFDRQVANAIDKIVAKVPQGHWLRSATFDQVAGPAKSWVESWSSKKGDVAAILGEKATDYLEMARRGLVEDSKAPNRRRPESGVDWREEFRKKAKQRLLRAASLGEERDRLLEEFAVLEDVMDAVDQAIEESLTSSVASPHPPVDPRERVRRIRELHRKAVKKRIANNAPRGHYRSPVVEVADFATDVVVTTTTKVVNGANGGAATLAGRLRQVRETHTERGVIVTDGARRQRGEKIERRMAKAKRAADRWADKEARREAKRNAKVARNCAREAKREARRNAKAERDAEKRRNRGKHRRTS